MQLDLTNVNHISSDVISKKSGLKVSTSKLVDDYASELEKHPSNNYNNSNLNNNSNEAKLSKLNLETEEKELNYSSQLSTNNNSYAKPQYKNSMNNISNYISSDVTQLKGMPCYNTVQNSNSYPKEKELLDSDCNLIFPSIKNNLSKLEKADSESNSCSIQSKNCKDRKSENTDEASTYSSSSGVCNLMEKFFYNSCNLYVFYKSVDFVQLKTLDYVRIIIYLINY